MHGRVALQFKPGSRVSCLSPGTAWPDVLWLTLLARRTLWSGCPVRLQSDWGKRTCEQQTADKKKYESFHGETPFEVDWEVQPW